MSKVVYLDACGRPAGEQALEVGYAAVVDERGREVPITEAMIQRALNCLDNQTHWPGPHRIAPRHALR